MYWPEPFRDREFWVYANEEPTAIPAFDQGYAKGRGYWRIREPAEIRQIQAEWRQRLAK